MCHFFITFLRTEGEISPEDSEMSIKRFSLQGKDNNLTVMS